MGRASKLFPLSVRKASVTSQTSVTMPQEQQPQLSKAERLLGATGLQTASRHQILRQPSYISLTPSISELGEEVEYVDFSTPDHFGQEPLPLRLADLQHGGTHDKLSNRISSGTSYSKTFHSDNNRRVKGSWSSATLNMRYEADHGHSLSNPQSNSYSHARDRNSRRGMPQVMEPNQRRPSTASVDSTSYDTKDSMDHATALPDMSRLHPKMAYAQQQYCQSPATPSPSVTSPRFPGAAPTSRPNTSAGSLKKAAGNATRSLKGHLSVDSFHSVKLFSRNKTVPSTTEVRSKPATRRKGIPKNWWDKFPVDEIDSDAESEHDPNLVTPTEQLFPQNVRGTPSPRASHNHMHPASRIDGSHSIRKMSSANEIISARSSVTVRSFQPPLSNRSRPSSRMTANDLHETSMLSTSSSSDSDSEQELDHHDQVNRNIRDSIAVSEIDVHHVGQAQALPLRTMRMIPESVCSDRRPSLASISSTMTTTDSSSMKSGTQGPAYLAVPHRSNRNRKSGHTRQPSSIPEDSDNSSQVLSPASLSASIRDFSSPHADNRKLMAVTEEEEALLEMMRRKRADKAAQRDSGLASITSSSTTRSNRPFSNLSGSSSILDSFPISRSQRSSLLASRAPVQELPSSHKDTDRGRKDADRGRKRQSVATTATDNTYYSIGSRLESPTRLKYAFTPHLSLASLDVSLTGLQPHNQDDSSRPSSEAPESPATPLTRRGSAEVLICEASSKRNSTASYAYGDRRHANEDVTRPRLNEKSRRKTTSNATPRASPGLDAFEHAKNQPEMPRPSAVSSDEESSPRLGSEDTSSSASSNRTSMVSKRTSDCGSACGHPGCTASQRASTGYGTGIGTRCSVSEDVLAAWGSLGGWRDPPGIMGGA